MPDFPEDLYYAETHEWVRIEGERAIVGISDFAQEQLGDVVYVELPELDTEVEAGEEIAVVESVKAASDIYAPVAGTVVERNERLDAEPEVVNSEPYGEGWFFVLRVASDEVPSELLAAAAYAKLCDAESS